MNTEVVVSYSISTSNHNYINSACDLPSLYLIPFLHQTTTSWLESLYDDGCILFHFYIKPQPQSKTKDDPKVVSYSISTSNHNKTGCHYEELHVVSYSISTSNHNILLPI